MITYPKKSKRSLSTNFHSCVIYGEKMWFVSTQGILMKYDCVNCHTDIVVPENVHEICFGQIIDSMVIFEDKIYFIEQDGSMLYEYDIVSNMCNSYQAPQVKMINWACYAGLYLYGDKIYLFTKDTMDIYCFDIRNKNFELIKSKYDKSVSCSMQKEHIAYLVCDKSIFCFNMKKRVFEEEYLFDNGEINSITSYQDYLYLLTKENQVISWNMKTGEKTILSDKNKEKDKFGSIFSTKNKLYLLPSLGNEIKIIDKLTNKISKGEEPEDLEYKEIGWAKYWNYFETEDYAYFANRVANYMLRINKKKEDMEWLKMLVPSGDETSYHKGRMYRNGFLLEENISLSDFLKII